MSVRTFTKLRYPLHVRWWEWCKILGAVGVIVLAALLVVGYVPRPAVAAVLVHVAADFTCQSDETAANKGERGRHLLIHACVAGGLPLAIAGLVTGNPVTVLTWTAVGIVGHYAVDWTRKFGLQSVVLGAILDQASHLLVILALTLLSW